MKLKSAVIILAFSPICTMIAEAAPIFNLPFFIEAGSSAIGIVPDLALSKNATAGVQLRFTQGLTDIINIQLGAGTRTGDGALTFGGGAGFDFVPDTKTTPGLGIAVQAYNSKKNDQMEVDFSVIPYIHKRFSKKSGNSVDPFLAVPFGVGKAALVLGSEFGISTHFRMSAELGINITGADTYFSSGLTYDP